MALQISANMSPPTPVIIGSTTESTAAAVTAASIALPPFSSTRIAAEVASGWLVAATPFGAYTGERPAMVAARWASTSANGARADRAAIVTARQGRRGMLILQFAK